MRLDARARHQRMLEGFLLRVANDPDADAFALRGGMLMRQRFGASRFARDVDLVCRLPFDAEDLRARVRRMLADSSVKDGVELEAERFRLDVMRPTSRHPGIRLFAAGRVDGRFCEISADFTYRLAVWPDAERRRFDTERGAGRLFFCPPAMLIGRKLQVTAELGRAHWRPKDLADLLVLLREARPSRAVLGEAVERAFHLEPAQVDAATLLSPSAWWRTERARRRWGQHARSHRRGTVPRELDAAVAELRRHLTPLVSASAPTLDRHGAAT